MHLYRKILKCSLFYSVLFKLKSWYLREMLNLMRQYIFVLVPNAKLTCDLLSISMIALYNITFSISFFLLIPARSNTIILSGSANFGILKKEKKTIWAVFWLNEECPKLLSGLRFDHRRRKTIPLWSSLGKERVLMKEKQGGSLPTGLKRWPLKLIKHLANTTCLSPSPAGPASCCPLNSLYPINLKIWVRAPNGCCKL